ncbi:hypothetical protein IX307_001732 [Bacteroides pyogenes]|nr:hypothetical protein [Bacteroides pyogenes]MBR8725290.1 hypothetical protein [Bacteroides pyogenes]MBR8738786.1 hypothetical protein [Bacteroides pyogenes]MBR8754500.1 hypothetical protein [Bacteroides pyogenes]MBR8787406.1 hypothetical protein [Bacteroides pyogenes]
MQLYCKYLFLVICAELAQMAHASMTLYPDEIKERTDYGNS